MDRAVIAVILLVAGVGLSLTVFGIAYGWLGTWGMSERIVIKHADITIDPSTGLGYVTVDLHNAGGIRLTGCRVRILPSIDVDDVATSDLPAGHSATFYEARVPGLQPSLVYVVEAVCQSSRAGAPVTVVDKKSVQAHI
jgi:hypothetical protein